jgi:hypothetical protein
VERSICPFQRIDLQVAEIKDQKSSLQPDVITMWHYLEHDYTPLENLTYLKSIAKPSTTLVIEIPNFDSMSVDENTVRPLAYTSSYFIIFSKYRAATQKGWKVSEINTYGTMDPYLLYWMSEMEQKNHMG